jgi:hypothetical protein
MGLLGRAERPVTVRGRRVFATLDPRRTVGAVDGHVRDGGDGNERSCAHVDVDTRTEGAVLLDRYVLERRLGSGGAGVVWRANDRLLQRPVAVKLLHPELTHDPAAAARFRSEASSAAKLTHPNAVIVYDIGRDRGRDFLVMELVDGPDLAELIADGPLAADTTAYLGAAIASALGLAHQRGMLHRDVKPANVLLDAAGVPKVADFGIARALGEATARLTAPGSVMGTARYLAPEQLLDGPLDGRVDVYALGLVLHEALTGRAPWGSGTALEIATRRLSGDLRPPSTIRSDIPPGLDAVIQRATRREADDRYPDGAAMAAALAPLAGETGRRHLDRRLRGLPGLAHPVPGLPHPAAPVPVGPDSPNAGEAEAAIAAPSAAAPSGAAAPVAVPTPRTRRTASPHGDASATPDRARPPRARPNRAMPDLRRLRRLGSSRPAAFRTPDRAAARSGSRRARDQRGTRHRRHVGRWLTLLLIAGLAAAGTQLAIPGVSELTDLIMDSDVGDLLREVRDGVSAGLPG